MTPEKPFVLVTGGAGYIGSHTCKALAREGYTPVVYDSLLRGHTTAVKWGPLEVGDLADDKRLREVICRYRPIGVIHFAAYAYVGESMHDPLMYYKNNVGGTLTLLGSMLAEGLDRIVFSSTCATYGVPASNPIDEAMPQRPINPYGESKLIVEKILKSCAQQDKFSAVALRYFNAAGADADGEIGEDHDPETHLIPLALQAALHSSKPLTIFGDDHPTHDGTCIRDYVHVSDLAHAHIRALQFTFERRGYTAFNLGTGKGRSILEIIRATEAISGRSVARFVGPRRPGDPAELVADPTRAHNELGWEAEHSDLENILRTAWSWMTRLHV